MPLALGTKLEVTLTASRYHCSEKKWAIRWRQTVQVRSTRVRSDANAGMHKTFTLLLLKFQASFWALNRGRGDTTPTKWMLRQFGLFIHTCNGTRFYSRASHLNHLDERGQSKRLRMQCNCCSTLSPTPCLGFPLEELAFCLISWILAEPVSVLFLCLSHYQKTCSRSSPK